MKNYYLFVGLLISAFFTEAQIPCSLDNFPGCRFCPPSYEGSTGGFTPDLINYDFSCGTIENSQWHSIVADSNPDGITLTFSTTQCTSGTGIEIVVFDSNLKPVLNCITLNENDLELRNISPTVPGETYYILIDGINGSDCDFRFFANNIANIPSLSPVSFSSTFPGLAPCGVSTCFSIDQGFPNNQYDWVVSDSTVVTSGGSFQDTFICLQYDLSFIAVDVISVFPINECQHGRQEDLLRDLLQVKFFEIAKRTMQSLICAIYLFWKKKATFEPND